MSAPSLEPIDQDGPLIRAASRRAEDVDNAASGERAGAWARFILPALAALAEGFVRQSMVSGGVLFSLIVAIMGATSGEVGWIVGGVLAGVGGAILVFVAVARWSFGRQWAVLVGVVVLQCLLMTAYWQTG